MGKAFNEINAGLLEAINHASGEETRIIVHKPKSVGVKAIRTKAGMTQKQFSDIFGLSVGTLRHWEQGARNPRGPALVLLNVMDRNPQAVLEALSAERNLTTV